MKMNMYPKETLADGINMGDEGSALVGPHNPAKLINTDMLRSEFVFDVLDGCAFNCAGCYIPRRNSCTPEDIVTANNIADTLQEMDISCEEMFIGPTDIFTATNFDEIMNTQAMYDLTTRFSISTSSTLMTPTKEIKKRWHVLQKHLNAAPARDFELLVAFDLQRYIANDREYLELLHTNLEMFKKDTVVFVVNYYEGMFNNTSLLHVAHNIHEEFNVPLRIIPSFFRAGATSTVERKSALFLEMLMIQLIDADIPDYLSINMFDKYFGGEGFINFSYKDGNLYLTPFIFEGIPQTHEIFRIERPYTPDSISRALKKLTTRQYQYAPETMACFNCPLLPSCVGRNVLAYMESRDLMDCIVPKTHIWDDNDYI